jgi:hypothetical protein
MKQKDTQQIYRVPSETDELRLVFCFSNLRRYLAPIVK